MPLIGARQDSGRRRQGCRQEGLWVGRAVRELCSRSTGQAVAVSRSRGRAGGEASMPRTYAAPAAPSRGAARPTAAANRAADRRPADRRPTADDRGCPAASRWGAAPSPERNAAPPEHERPRRPGEAADGRQRPRRASGPRRIPCRAPSDPGEDLRARRGKTIPGREKARSA